MYRTESRTEQTDVGAGRGSKQEKAVSSFVCESLQRHRSRRRRRESEERSEKSKQMRRKTQSVTKNAINRSRVDEGVRRQ